ncbi:hypothetical protein, partial [Endozoicomonas sp. ONNA1]|uniref:hypothetical protein n=1 Tax=Endozoicomonas sp. ONNA1 TaxID=2828740 RepID=UPI0021475E75
MTNLFNLILPDWLLVVQKKPITNNLVKVFAINRPGFLNAVTATERGIRLSFRINKQGALCSNQFQ